MTKENLTSINVIVDGSGSMAGLTTDTIGSFNQFLTEQKLVPGEAIFTLCIFNTHYNLVHDFVTLASVPDLDVHTYRPYGGTALLDAMGTTMDSVGQKLAAMQEEDRPSKVIVLIITDGQENSSRNFTKEQIKSMVERQRDTYKWEFVFMGANIDSITEGQALGISMSNSMNYDSTSVGTKSLYKSVSDNLRTYRSSNSSQVDFFNQPTVPTNTVVTPPVATVTIPDPKTVKSSARTTTKIIKK